MQHEFLTIPGTRFSAHRMIVSGDDRDKFMRVYGNGPVNVTVTGNVIEISPVKATTTVTQDDDPGIDSDLANLTDADIDVMRGELGLKRIKGETRQEMEKRIVEERKVRATVKV
jgi:hypothetical protein